MATSGRKTSTRPLQSSRRRPQTMSLLLAVSMRVWGVSLGLGSAFVGYRNSGLTGLTARRLNSEIAAGLQFPPFLMSLLKTHDAANHQMTHSRCRHARTHTRTHMLTHQLVLACLDAAKGRGGANSKGAKERGGSDIYKVRYECL